MIRLLSSIAIGLLLVVGHSAFGHAQGKGGQSGPSAKADANLMTISRTGQVLRTHSTTAIFWGDEWNSPVFADDIVTGMDAFFSGFGGSPLAGILTEYYDRTGSISSSSTYFGHVVDASQPLAGTLSSATVIGEACAMTNNNPDPNGIYFVYTSTAATLSGTCATRTWGTCGKRGAPIQVVYVPFMTGEDDGCSGVLNHGDDGSVTGHSTALGQYGNVTANQLMNAITDPRGTGWKDAAGNGISLKCDGIFIPSGTYETFSNGSMWTVRAKWSNAAYLAGTGLPNPQGLPGCVY